MIRPRLTAETSEPFGRVAGDPARDRPEITAILKLPTFERFAFVMSVLEGYSDHECALHLACMRADVTAARTRALEQMRKSAELHRTPGEYRLGPERTRERSESRAQLQAFSGEPLRDEAPFFSPLTRTRS